ncbi:excalibur calcium-binding domain-containing protein [Streptomyces sp. 1268]|uniref:excalibur calcium-binding domain-containing protein n=1 Tax=Streptomyces sp. 1268 TaxID=3231942 RepID=UPI0038D45A5E
MDWNSSQHPSRQPGWGQGGDFTPQPASTGGPRWARKRVVLPAAGVLFLLGIGIGATGEQPEEVRTVAAKTKPGPTVTVTETATVTVTATPEPAPTVTKVKKVRVTVTAAPPEPEPAKKPVARDDSTGGSGSSGGSGGSGGTSAYYKNCDAVRAAGAAPIRSGQPGYGRHLDRDGDGVGCE